MSFNLSIVFMSGYWDFLTDSISEGSFITIIELLGTVAFAISGIRLASAKMFDWFGALVVGFVTAVGGGTLRDLLLGEPVFWMQSSLYAWGTFLAFLIVLCFRKYLVHLNNTIFWFDCIGLGLFTLVGFEKTLNLEYAYWVCIFMGTITGVVGGITRDILIHEIPIIFRQELYAVACVIGGFLYVGLLYFDVDKFAIQIAVFLIVILVRFLATHYRLSLPTLKPES